MIMRGFLDVNNDLIVNTKAIESIMPGAAFTGMQPPVTVELFAMAGHSTSRSSVPVIPPPPSFFRLKKVAPAVLVDPSSSFRHRVVNMYPLIIHWVACICGQWLIGTRKDMSENRIGREDHHG